MDWFHREVTAIENEARHFIDDSFKTLRSAEGAFDMLLNFRHIRSREAINSQMMKKFNDILVQFGKEVFLRTCEFSLHFNLYTRQEHSRCTFKHHLGKCLQFCSLFTV